MPKYSGYCPCGDYEFTIKYISPSNEEVQIYCPFCGVEIEEEFEEKEEYDYDDE